MAKSELFKMDTKYPTENYLFYNHNVHLCVCPPNSESMTCSQLIMYSLLTLIVEFPDNSVQVGVLERHMAAFHRHYFPDT